jgi:hypothetical protein
MLGSTVSGWDCAIVSNPVDYAAAASVQQREGCTISCSQPDREFVILGIIYADVEIKCFRKLAWHDHIFMRLTVVVNYRKLAD